MKKILINTLYIFVILFLIGVLFSISVFIYFAKDLPRPERYTEYPVIRQTEIYDRTGENKLYTIYGEEVREIISIEEVPQHFINALLTAEDRSFYSHFGIDFKGIIRSFILNFQSGETVAGGSTISQQFVRSAFLTTEKKVMRKIREIVLTVELERRYSKNEILEFYLNQVPFGSNIYGVESASNMYFNKSAKELSLAESAILVSLLPAPSYYSPFGENVDILLSRKDRLLDSMNKEGFITKNKAEETKEEDVTFYRSPEYIKAPHFVLDVKKSLEEKYGEDFIKEKGLKIYTTIDYDIQKRIEEVVKEKVKENYRYNAYNAAVVVIDPNTGEVIAMVGSADYFGDPLPKGCTPGVDCKFDPFTNVTNKERQPGSSFKPFVYAIAFENGYSGETVVIDEKTNFGTLSNPYIPRNYDGLFRGEVTLRESLAQSLNVPAVKVLRDFAGLKYTVEKVRDFGINLSQSYEFYGLPLVLGGGDVKLIEIALAYGIFANDGYKNNLLSVLKITDKEGNIIEDNNNTSQKRVIKSSTAEEITDILSDNNARAPVFGQNSLLYIEGYDIAVKTGSTQNFRDAWCIGYNDDFIVGVWVGNNDNSYMVNAPGVAVATPIWREVFEILLEE
jgi:1A family penicillin-binding protein